MIYSDQLAYSRHNAAKYMSHTKGRRSPVTISPPFTMPHAEPNDIIEVRCTARRPKGRVCNAYLGGFRGDCPTTVLHHCKNCKVTYMHTVGADGDITVQTVSKRVTSYDSPARVYAGQ